MYFYPTNILFYICCYFYLFFIVFLIPGHLNGIHACSKTIQLEVGQLLQYKYLQNSGEARW